MIGETVGNYRVQSKLGEGGMGEVYLGVHLLMGRRAALKVLLPEHSRKRTSSERFLIEAQATARLRHPGIVEIFDCGREAERIFIAMELLEGETLRAALDRGGGVFPDSRGLGAIGAQVAAALAAAHRAGVVHRDLKPENVFLVRSASGGPVVKVLDFGIAKLIDIQAAASNLRTNTGGWIGTPAYMSPEQCVGTGQVDGRSDIYSLGCILFEALHGRPPFVEEAFGALMLAHLSMPPPVLESRVPEVPAELLALIARCLAKDPAQRPRDMDEVSDELLAINRQLGGLPVEIAEWIPPPEPAVPSQHTTLLAASTERRAPLAVAEPLPPSDPQRHAGMPRRGLIAVAAAGALAAAVWLATRAAPQVRPASPQPPEQAPVSAPEIVIDVPGLPPAATVLVDGKPAIPPLRLARNGQRVHLEVSAPGHVSRTITLEATRDQTLALELTPSSPGSATEGPPSQPASAPASRKSRTKRSRLFTDL